MILFSIIIPIHNTEKYIEECIQSILIQNICNIEIILINDCSTDRSGEIADMYCRKYEYIKVIHHHNNCGVSVSRNDGVKAAKGKYVIFVDSDDRLFDGSLLGIRKLIEEKPGKDLIIARATSQHGEWSNDYLFDSSIINTTNIDEYIAHMNIANYHPEQCWHYIIDRQFIIENELEFADVKIAEDQEYVAKLFCLTNTFSFYNEKFYWYRERDFSLKKSLDFYATKSLLVIANEMFEFISEKPLSGVKIAFLILRIRHALGLFSARLIMHDSEEVRQLSLFFVKYEKNLKRICECFPNVDMYGIIKEYGEYSCLSVYKKMIIEKTRSLMKDYHHKELYIYCTGLIGKATARILLDEGYKVAGVLDDNKTLQGLFMAGLQIYGLSALSDRTKEEMSSLFVIVCNQKTMLFESIAKRLQTMGLKKEQIVHMTY